MIEFTGVYDMRSKYFVHLMMLSIFFVSCSSPIKDRPKEQSTISLGSSETQCLSTVSTDIKEYFEGHSTVVKTEKMWDCASRALELFSQFTKGKNENYFEPQELRNFLQKYFLGDLRISDEFLTAGMKLKSVILGGSDSVLSKDDIANTRKLIEVLKKVTVKLQPYQPIRPSHINELEESVVDQAVNELRSATKLLGNALSETSKDYAFSDFISLFTNLNSFFAQSKVNVFELSSLLELFPVIIEVKNLAISRPKEIISKSDWSRILEMGALWYGWILKASNMHHQYVVTQAKNISIPMLFWGQGIRRMFTLLIEMKDIVVNSIKSWPSNMIPMSEFYSLVDKIGDERISEWFVEGLTADTMKKTITPLIRRLMNGLNQVQFMTKSVEATKPNGVKKKVEVGHREGPNGLTIEAMDNLVTEISRFVDGQIYIEALFDKVAGKDNWTLSRAYDQGELIANSFYINPELTNKEVAYDIRNIIKTTRPLFRGEEPKIFFTDSKTADTNHSFYNLFQNNWMTMVARIFIRGYATDKSRAEGVSGLNLRELTGIYDDFWYFGRDIKFLDKRENTHTKRHKTAMKRFMEANIFSFESDGGDTLKLNELTQLLAFLVSSKTLSSKIHQQLAAICKVGEADVFGKPLIDANCFQNSLFDDKEKLYEQYWSTMPRLKSYYSSLDDKAKHYFKLLLIKAAMGDHVDNYMYESDDTDALASILHYVEAVFSRFDEDSVGGIDKYEAAKAFPIFEYELSKLSCTTNQKILKNIFTYLLHHGEQPDPKFPKMLSFVWWMAKDKVGLQSLHADRIRMLEILGTISDATTSTSASIDNQNKSCPGEDEGVLYEENQE